METDHTALQDARSLDAERNQATQAAIVAAFNTAAERIEAMARKLGQTVNDGGNSVAQG